jgi:hypothetical protein
VTRTQRAANNVIPTISPVFWLDERDEAEELLEHPL